MNFVDTGIFVAIHLTGDQHHQAARALLLKLAQPAVTSNHVVAELAKLLARRAGYSFAAECIADMYAAPRLDIVASTREDELAALRWMRKYADQRIGFTDCLSFAIMQRYRIRTALTFDRHFQVAGFDVIGLP
jgi:hypothetical protein